MKNYLTTGNVRDANKVRINSIELNNESIEMERRKIPIIIHSAVPPGFPNEPITGKNPPVFEFIADTTMPVLDMLSSEMLNRHPGIRIIIPHNGSDLLLYRVINMKPWLQKADVGLFPP